MTRLETSGEPSMEEILASIRRIIAEEPAGARGVPAPRPQLAPSTQPAREQPAPFSLGAKRDFIPRTEPASPSPASASAQSTAREAARPSPESSWQGNMRQNAADAAAKKPAESIQAQLDDLLADERETAAATAEAPPTPASSQHSAPQNDSANEGAGQPRFKISRDGYLPAPAEDRDTHSDPFDFDLGPSPFSKRPSQPLTATNADAEQAEPKPADEQRDRSAPAEAAASPRTEAAKDEARMSPAPAPAPAKSNSVAEPERGAPAKATLAEPAPAIEATRAKIERPEALKIEPAPPEAEKAAGASAQAKPEAAKHETAAQEPTARPIAPQASPRRDEAPAYKSEPATFHAAAGVRSPAIESRTVKPLASPSIAATLPPAAEIAAAKARSEAEAFARSLDMLSSRAAHDPIKDVVTEAVNIAMGPAPSKYSAVDLGGAPIAVELVDPAPASLRHQVALREPGGASQSANVPAVRDGDTGIRSMEDTVADLLRPMLKIWLAENMPKIIERALRREISEMTGHQHKTAAE